MQRHEILHAYSPFIDLAAGQISEGSLHKQRSYERLFFRTQRPCGPSLLKCLGRNHAETSHWCQKMRPRPKCPDTKFEMTPCTWGGVIALETRYTPVFEAPFLRTYQTDTTCAYTPRAPPPGGTFWHQFRADPRWSLFQCSKAPVRSLNGTLWGFIAHPL